MKPSEETTEEEELRSHACQTDVEQHHGTLYWTLNNFNLIFPGSDHPWGSGSNQNTIESPQTTLTLYQHKTCDYTDKPQKHKIKWSVVLRFSSRSASNCMMAAEVKLDSSSQPLLHNMSLTLSIIGKDYKEVLKKSHQTHAHVGSNHDSISCPSVQLVTVDEMYKNQPLYFVSKDTLNLKAELTFVRKPYTRGLHKYVAQTSLVDELVLNLREMMRDAKSADVQVSCANKEFYLHSYVLRSRSPVFRRMLQSGLTESTTKIIQIDGVDPVDFEAFVEFLYTAKIPEFSHKNVGIYLGLVQLADKYEILDLKSRCFEFLCKFISVENAADVAVLSHLHLAHEHVRDRVVAFCLRNWIELSNNENFQKCIRENPSAFLPRLFLVPKPLPSSSDPANQSTSNNTAVNSNIP